MTRVVTVEGAARPTTDVQLLFHGRDAEGSIEVIEHAGVRYLHFGTHAHQSAHDLANPRALVLECTRRMAASLLLIEPPRDVLLLGLGGGALARFLHEALPDCSILAVERRALVVELARRYFDLPGGERLQLRVGDAVDAVTALGERRFDLVLVDLFTGRGPDESVLSTCLFQHCRRSMRPDAALASNYWSRDMPPLDHPGNVIARCFPSAARLHSPEGNRVLFGLPAWPPDVVGAPARARARALTKRTGVDFELLRQTVVEHNAARLELCLDERAGLGARGPRGDVRAA